MTNRSLARCGLFGLGAFFVGALALLFLGLNTSEAQSRDSTRQQAAAAARGVESEDSTCLTCHNNPQVTAIYGTPHGLSALSGAASSAGTCANCHGDSASHGQSLQSPGIVFSNEGRFPASDKAVQNQTCLNCHQSRETVHWSGSAHQAADLACADCHTIHASHATALNELSDASVCLRCHLEQRAQMNLRSHHPVAEGLMTCNDCHNPHGSDAMALLSRISVNETCTSCHAEKRGPFLWEHQPVTEDCTYCHTPHGSTQDRLLSVRQPFLCQTCHSEAFHPSSLYSGTGLPPAGAQQNLLGSSCTNCHSLVHGSNHPSGSRLTR
ncbi:MAG: DmsE family decaheme c-type cytochrome [Proteobacteria bacterium]|nr:DmsE family decaheme c-type cytochrome [Pseudomonadota bacterium]MDA0928009.1 DmsE family decaheme c-type cytochrome [Pseudomonadota bacterium]